MNNFKKIGIYIHIPFCASKCFYCNFVSFENINNNIIDKYIKALIYQIKNEYFYFNKKDFENILIDTIYIGGGTPSFINEKYIYEILKAIKSRFKISNDAEITIETNPESLTKNKVISYKSYGINRISIGLQTTQDNFLKAIGRPHTFSDFEKIYNFSKNFFRTNIDLIFALPDQNLDDLKKDLKNILNLNPDSISVYSLILEENTFLYNIQNSLNFPNEYLERKMQKYIYNFLEKNDYIRYEISNFSKKNKYSRHNTNTWLQHEYLGFGLNSSSYFKKFRFSNTSNLNNFINYYSKYKNNLNENINIYTLEEKQNLFEEMKEHIYLGLRMRTYDTEIFFNKFNKKCEDVFKYEFNEIKKLNLIDIKEKNNGFHIISLNEKGLDLANKVLIYFI